MDGDLSALPPSAALPPISTTSPSTTTTALSAPPPPKTHTITNPSPAPTPIPPTSISTTLAKYTSLLSPALHTTILAFSDEFFAPASNLISPGPPIRKPGVYVETGAWYDGWETRRHNASKDGESGEVCDWVTFQLGVKARVRAVEVDTFAFVGNQGEGARVLGACQSGDGDAGGVKWDTEVLPKQKLEGDTRHAWLVGGDDGVGGGEVDGGITHVKLQMFPDGGIARFRLYGDVLPNFAPLHTLSPAEKTQEIELSAALNGGVVTGQSDQHFGKAANLLLPGRGVDMGDGWETKRSRGVGHEDSVVVKLGARGRVSRVVVDTMHFRGNFPRGVRVEGMDAGGKEGSEESDLPLRRMGEKDGLGKGEGAGDGEGTGMAGEGGFFERDEGTAKAVEKEDKGEEWKVLGVVEQCEKDKEHEIVVEGGVACTHAKMVIIPDGGVKRFRVFGTRV
ncbi:MAG: Allantoicase [Ramalina farinacea]|uniref:Allantoicase n=1 Tax=Ramalina farinacea TaxID=258253 RepID=A0AA43QLJ6_9LECA|nr:Allantoicase [Ramalina farinacea]